MFNVKKSMCIYNFAYVLEKKLVNSAYVLEMFFYFCFVISVSYICLIEN